MINSLFQVKIWFQNRRSKMKKQNKPPDADSSSSSYVMGGDGAADHASPAPHTEHDVAGAAWQYRDSDNTRSMLPPPVYRRREATPAQPCSHETARVAAASAPEDSHVRPNSKMHLMTRYD